MGGASGNMAPGYLKCFFPMCGGPVGTLSKFECAVPADQKDNFNSAKDSYNKAKDELAKCELAARNALRVRSQLSGRLLPSCFQVVLLHSRLLQQRSASPYYSSCGGQ